MVGRFSQEWQEEDHVYAYGRSGGAHYMVSYNHWSEAGEKKQYVAVTIPNAGMATGAIVEAQIIANKAQLLAEGHLLPTHRGETEVPIPALFLITVEEEKNSRGRVAITLFKEGEFEKRWHSLETPSGKSSVRVSGRRYLGNGKERIVN